MKNYTIKIYDAGDCAQWNNFISEAKNATFLFNRSFMDYHADRFQDCSLIVADGEKWLAVLPAHQVGNILYSHSGLTYGGLVYSEKLKLVQVIAILKSILVFLEHKSVEKLHIKMIPAIYHKKPADELDYALFLAKAATVRCDSLAVLDLTKPFKITKTRKESIRRGIKNELIIKEESNFRLFWEEILIPNLNKKHAAKPVHSIAEIERLHQLFPDTIRHFNVYHNDKIVAGTTVFVSDQVAHPQYISGEDNKNELGSLDYLYHHLITKVFQEKHFFDFGISNEEQGKKLNEGLMFWKESFGTGTVTQHFYEVETKNHHLLDNILV